MSDEKKTVEEWLAVWTPEEVAQVDANDDYSELMCDGIAMMEAAIDVLPDGECASCSPRKAAKEEWYIPSTDPDNYDVDEMTEVARVIGEIALYIAPEYGKPYDCFVRAGTLMAAAIDKVKRAQLRDEWVDEDGGWEGAARGLRHL